jgi:hypothetical protein
MSDGDHLAFADQIYSCSKAASLVRHSVSFPELATFSRDLIKLRRRLGDEADEEYWTAFLRPLRRYVFLLCSTPLSAIDAAIHNPELHKRLKDHLNRAKLIYPSFADEAADLLENYSEITRHPDSPLLTAVKAIVESAKETALLLKDSRLTKAVEKALPPTPFTEIEVIGPNHLRGESCYDKLIVLGAPSWYPEYIFAAPRAREIHVVTYNWLTSAWKNEPAFLHAESSRTVVQHPRLSSEAKAVECSDTNDLFTEEEFLPQIDLDALSEKLTGRYRGEHEYELTDARLLSLEGGALVFIEAGEKSKVLIIDPDGDSSASARGEVLRLRRIPSSYVEPGNYILLRTSGGGDYIVPLADRLLGKNASYVRIGQEHWKSLLRSEVSKRGLFAVSVALLDLGSIRAEETNVRNWMSRRSIRPDDKRDFMAIMKLIGLENKIEEDWRNARALTNAHLRAGALIRRMLLKEVATADLDELERMGRMVFELPGNAAGSLTAFRVLSSTHQTYRVPMSKLDDPFHDEDDLWPE